MKRVAVVILNYNGRGFLEKFLPKVIANSADAEVIVADNQSTDDSVAFLKQNFPSIRLIVNSENGGFAKGYNDALKSVQAEYYVLLNSDIEVTENWIHPCIELLESDDSIVAVQPKVLAHHDPQRFEHAGAAGGFLDKDFYPFCQGRIFEQTEMDKNQYEQVREIFWATGACLFIRSSAYHEVGGLDEDFFAHMEEIDFCWQLKNLGYRIVCNPESTVYHVGGGTLPNDSPFKLYLNFRNNLFLLYKNIPSGSLISTLFARMILDGISAFVFLAKFSFAKFWSVLKAHINFYQSLKKLRIKRKKLLHNKVANQHAEIYSGSILVAYFLKKTRSFSGLKFKN